MECLDSVVLRPSSIAAVDLSISFRVTLWTLVVPLTLFRLILVEPAPEPQYIVISLFQ